jgi:hypothetical protein
MSETKYGEFQTQMIDQSKSYVPSEMIYKNVIPVGAPAMTQDLYVDALGSSYDPNTNNLIQFNIPCDGNSFIDWSHSYFRFDIKNTCADILMVDHSAYSVFNRMRLTMNGKIIEDIPSYNVLCNLFLKTQLSRNETEGLMNALVGTPSFDLADATKTIALTYTAGPPISVSGTAKNIAAGLASGIHGGENRASVSIAAAGSQNFCLPLIGGVFNSDKYFPVNLLSTCKLEYQLEQANLGLVNIQDTVNNTYEVSNCRLVLRVIRLAEDLMGRFKNNAMSGLQLHFQGMKSAPDVVTGTGNFTTKVDFRYRSIKSLFSVVRRNDQLVKNKHSTSSFIRDGSTDYQYIVNGSYYPAQPIVIGSQSTAELVKSLKKFNSLQSLGFLNRSSALANTHDGAVGGDNVVLSYDFERYTGSPLESGLNTSRNSTSVQLNVNRTGGTANSRIDHFALIDSILTFVPQNGDVIISEA